MNGRLTWHNFGAKEPYKTRLVCTGDLRSYRVAKRHRMPCICRSLFAKESYYYWLLCGNRPVSSQPCTQPTHQEKGREKKKRGKKKRAKKGPAKQGSCPIENVAIAYGNIFK